MKVLKIAAPGLILLSFLACTPSLVPSGWELLGKRDVGFGVDHDAITVPAQKGAFSKLLVVVRMNDLELYDIRVTFESGADFSPNFRGKFIANRDTQIIDLPGAARRIRKVDFRYRSLLRTARRAVVELYGK